MEIGKKTITILMLLLVFVSLLGTFLVISKAAEIRSIRIIQEENINGRVALNLEKQPSNQTEASAGKIYLSVKEGSIGGSRK